MTRLGHLFARTFCILERAEPLSPWIILWGATIRAPFCKVVARKKTAQALLPDAP
jgi:hypothetical protein